MGGGYKLFSHNILGKDVVAVIFVSILRQNLHT